MLLDTNDCLRGTVVTIIRSVVTLFWYKCMVLVSVRVRDYMLNYSQSLSLWQKHFSELPK